MKKYLLVMAVFSLIFAFACGGGSNDPKAVMGEYLDAFEDYINGLTKVNSADDLVKVTEAVNAKFEKLLPRIKEVLKQHPELKMSGNESMPEEYKEIEERMKKLLPKLFESMGKIGQYMTDPKVIEAQKKMQKLMTDAK